MEGNNVEKCHFSIWKEMQKSINLHGNYHILVSRVWNVKQIACAGCLTKFKKAPDLEKYQEYIKTPHFCCFISHHISKVYPPVCFENGNWCPGHLDEYPIGLDLKVKILIGSTKNVVGFLVLVRGNFFYITWNLISMALFWATT